MKIFIIVIGVFLMASSIYGEEKHPIDKKWEEAVKSDTSTAGGKKATKNAINEWEQELNKYYNLLINELVGKEKESLKKSQSDWETYRDEEINFINQLYGIMRGSYFSVLKIEKQMEIVRKRALELKFNYDLLMDEKPYDYYR